jgi:hypothetical protein
MWWRSSLRASFPAGSQSGTGGFAGGTWLYLGLAITGLVGRVVVVESLLTAMLPIPFLLAAAIWNEWLYGRWSRTAQVNRVDVGRR